MKFILILLSMMFVLTLMAIPIDNDVGLLNSSVVVYTKPETVVVPAQTVISQPSVGYCNENRQYPILEGESVKGVDIGSINRFVLLTCTSDYDKPESYNGHSFDCVNKLL